MAGGAGPIRTKLKEKKQAKVIGQEYWAKKAGGDVKKKGRVDPYAYVPLTPLRKGPKDGLSLTNKSKADKAQERQAWTEVVRHCRHYSIVSFTPAFCHLSTCLLVYLSHHTVHRVQRIKQDSIGALF
ncbi:MAG: hypothetical protein J3Q66DRAFT_334147 [Benniella sp.]|nr:MAG: hypothetical protein J3Q66DRAFT_334147 [Benniella sp.]